MKNQDIDIIAYALRKAIEDEQIKVKHRKTEGNVDAENGSHARLVRLRKALNEFDALGAVSG